MSIDERTAECITAAWRDQFGWEGVMHGEGPGQRWLYHPLLGTICAADASSEVRRFLADFFRWTRVRWRALPQFALGTVVTRRPLLALLGRPVFVCTPPVPRASEQLIIPRARRVRLFDFATRRTRCVSLAGAADPGILAELAVRSGGEGPFPSITAQAEDGSWYEEPLVQGYTLARPPPWTRASRVELDALRSLEQWSAGTREERPGEQYARSLTSGLPSDLAARLVRYVSRVGRVSLVRSHGDCQPGNAIIDRGTGGVVWIDWEYSALRSEHYDRLTLGLASRSPRGLERRVVRCAAGQADHPALVALPTGRVARRGTLALWLLEDLRWRLDRETSDPAVALLLAAGEAL